MSSKYGTLLRGRGFTLIEVMIVVTIVAILAAVALPSYQDYVRRGKVVEAGQLLSQQRIRLEQYFQDNRNYGTSSVCGTGAITGKYFSVVCVASGANFQNYTLTATSTGTLTDHVYAVDDANVMVTTKFKGATVTKGCWVFKGDEC